MRKGNYQKIELIANNEIYSGQSIERYVEQAETSKQPIEGGSPEIFTPRSEGVKAEYNIRTDRWEIALRAMDHVSGSIAAKRADFIKQQNETKGGTAETTEGAA